METQDKCPNCGSTDDVVTVLEYVGGHAYVPVTGCRDRVACWKRWDKQCERIARESKLMMNLSEKSSYLGPGERDYASSSN